MKTVIMAGGEGKRLKAISGEAPKPMVMLCGRPVMEHIVLLLKKHGLSDICAALKYRPEVIKEYFGSGEKLGVNIQYRVEEKALGTAGGVKNCADFYGDEDFLVLSGDAVCDLDLTQLISEHRKQKSAVTLALYPHPEPLSYGLALCGVDGSVRSFIEKPDWAKVVTNLVNTGIYVISPRVMELVPENTEYDFAKDLFPELMRRGEKLLGVTPDGYWCDIGTPKSYYECCADALSGKVSLSLSGGFESACACERGCERASRSGGIDVSCRDRARLMDRVSSVFLDMGAELSDGFILRGDGYELRINALPETAALRISASAGSAELASELCFSASELVKELENRLE